MAFKKNNTTRELHLILDSLALDTSAHTNLNLSMCWCSCAFVVVLSVFTDVVANKSIDEEKLYKKETEQRKKRRNAV